MSEIDSGEIEWEPAPSERKYFRDATSGDLGYLIRAGGKDVIRLDRPFEVILHPMTGRWVPEHSHAQFSKFQVAIIAYEADRALLQAMGKYQEAKKEYASMREKDRIDWMKFGPKEDDLRKDLFCAIIEVLGEHAK